MLHRRKKHKKRTSMRWSVQAWQRSCVCHNIEGNKAWAMYFWGRGLCRRRLLGQRVAKGAALLEGEGWRAKHHHKGTPARARDAMRVLHVHCMSNLWALYALVTKQYLVDWDTGVCLSVLCACRHAAHCSVPPQVRNNGHLRRAPQTRIDPGPDRQTCVLDFFCLKKRCERTGSHVAAALQVNTSSVVKVQTDSGMWVVCMCVWAPAQAACGALHTAA